MQERAYELHSAGLKHKEIALAFGVKRAAITRRLTRRRHRLGIVRELTGRRPRLHLTQLSIFTHLH